MTTTTLSPSALSSPSALRRIINVVRLHLVNRSQLVVVPWLIMGFIFMLFMAVGWILHTALPPEELSKANEGMEFNGSMGYFFVYMLVLAVMAISQTFPFAQSYSVTRRDFYFGTVVTFFGLSVAYSLAITMLSWLEDLTGGWGLDMVIFSPAYLGQNLAVRFYFSVVLFLLFFMAGMVTASVYVRWRVNGMLIFFAIVIVIIVGFAALATFTASWGSIGTWFTSMGLLGVVSWTLAPSTLALVTGYFILRGATPRN